jgi:hypothetical protein
MEQARRLTSSATAFVGTSIRGLEASSRRP